MQKKQDVLKLHRQGDHSIRRIAKQVGLHRKTVNAYITAFELAKAKSEKGDVDDFEFVHTLPKQKVHKGTSVLNWAVIGPIIDGILESSTHIHKKMQADITHIYEELIRQNHEISYSSVTAYIRKKEQSRRQAEAFIKQTYKLGNTCEFDWGDCYLTIKGTYGTFQMAVFTCAYSNYRFSMLFEHQNTLAYQESHRSFFSHIQGVLTEMVYDNMRVAIKSFVGGKTPTRALTGLCAFYGFNYRFCNIRKGNEKGHVERSVDVVRKYAFSCKQSFDSFDEAQAHLLAQCEVVNNKINRATGKSAKDLFEQERPYLLAYQGDIACFERRSAKVDKLCTFSFDSARYSVPDHLVGRTVEVKIKSAELQVYWSNELVATWERDYSKGWNMNIEHYLTTLGRKPGALKNSCALKQAPKNIVSLFDAEFVGNEKDFIILLLYCKDKKISHQKLFKAYQELKPKCSKEISSDMFINYLSQPKEAIMAPNCTSIEVGNTDITAQSTHTLTQANALLNEKR